MVNEFGWCCSPVAGYKLWEDEEKILLDLRPRRCPTRKRRRCSPRAGRAPAGSAIGSAGMLSPRAQREAEGAGEEAAGAAVDGVFRPAPQKVLEDLIASDGGVEVQRVAIWGDATKGHMDGGNYSWKIGGAGC